ncbi:hypothetical protein BJ508DRAFT_315088 [Ascobolus immersus RN42]|uniref:Uncharacterized protein n=1 Tax=Ascobolus immersus RN42 TaxID=1160509 RepID=A0A3N4HQV1_ASCIM|nr:hypothetical protein BJ508DRAFT_315088 [Ascobolus immersus RN42]
MGKNKSSKKRTHSQTVSQSQDQSASSQLDDNLPETRANSVEPAFTKKKDAGAELHKTKDGKVKKKSKKDTKSAVAIPEVIEEAILEHVSSEAPLSEEVAQTPWDTDVIMTTQNIQSTETSLDVPGGLMSLSEIVDSHGLQASQFNSGGGLTSRTEIPDSQESQVSQYSVVFSGDSQRSIPWNDDVEKQRQHQNESQASESEINRNSQKGSQKSDVTMKSQFTQSTDSQERSQKSDVTMKSQFTESTDSQDIRSQIRQAMKIRTEWPMHRTS